MKISDLRVPPGAKKRRKRVGCGPGSGHGKTSGRGHKGAKQRSGKEFNARFEGGQMPLIRRIPKRGFVNPFKKEYAILNLSQLKTLEKEVNEITPELLREKGIIKKNLLLKILGEGTITQPLTIKAHAFSKSAKEKIEAVGGTALIITPPQT